nr:hypothetical protein SHINE37_40332 [Rhizobiaceae bacterium]
MRATAVVVRPHSIGFRVGFTPLWPAGHLPHKEGDRLEAGTLLKWQR